MYVDILFDFKSPQKGLLEGQPIKPPFLFSVLLRAFLSISFSSCVKNPRQAPSPIYTSPRLLSRRVIEPLRHQMSYVPKILAIRSLCSYPVSILCIHLDRRRDHLSFSSTASLPPSGPLLVPSLFLFIF